MVALQKTKPLLTWPGTELTVIDHVFLLPFSSSTEARGEIQNFVHNFLENPTQEENGHQSDEDQEELNVEIVKEEQMVECA